MKKILHTFSIFLCIFFFHAICMDNDPLPQPPSESTQQKRSYLRTIKNWGSLQRKIQELATKMGTESSQSPRSPKTPPSQPSSATSTPRTPHEEQESASQSSPLQTQNERALARKAKKEEREAQNYEKTIAQMRKYILKGDATRLAKLCNQKTLTPRLFQYIAEATGVPNLQQLLDIIISTKKDSCSEMCKKFLERYGTTPLHSAVNFNNKEALLGFGCILGIIDTESSINNLVDDQKRPPLFDAVSTNIAQQLINCGAKVNAQDNEGNTFLHYCCAQGKTDMIKFLLKRGAKLTQENSEGQSPFLYRVPATKDAFNLLLGNILANPKLMLLTHDKRGHNALHRLILSKASIKNKVRFARILKNVGVSISQKDFEGNLPQHIWAAYGVMPGAKELIEFAITECNIDITAKNNNLQTALDLALKIPGASSKNISLSRSIEGPLGERIKRQCSNHNDIETESRILDSLLEYLQWTSAQQWSINQDKSEHSFEYFDCFCEYLKQNSLQSWADTQEAFSNKARLLQIQELFILKQLQKESLNNKQIDLIDDNNSESFSSNSSDLYMHSNYSDFSNEDI